MSPCDSLYHPQSDIQEDDHYKDPVIKELHLSLNKALSSKKRCSGSEEDEARAIDKKEIVNNSFDMLEGVFDKIGEMQAASSSRLSKYPIFDTSTVLNAATKCGLPKKYIHHNDFFYLIVFLYY